MMSLQLWISEAGLGLENPDLEVYYKYPLEVWLTGD